MGSITMFRINKDIMMVPTVGTVMEQLAAVLHAPDSISAPNLYLCDSR